MHVILWLAQDTQNVLKKYTKLLLEVVNYVICVKEDSLMEISGKVVNCKKELNYCK